MPTAVLTLAAVALVVAPQDSRAPEVAWLGTPDRPSESLHRMAFSPDGKLLAHTGDSGEIRLIDAATARYVRSWKRPGRVDGLAFVDGGNLLATLEPDGLRLWKAADALEVRHLKGHDAKALSLAGAGSLMATGDVRGKVRLWSVDGTEKREVDFDVMGAAELALSGDGKRLAVGGAKSMIEILHLDTGERVSVALKSYPQWIGFSPDGSTLASIDAKGRILAVNASTGGIGWSTPAPLRVGPSSAAFAASGKEMWTSDGTGLALRSVSDGKEVRRIDTGRGEGRVVLSPDGKLLVTGGAGAPLRFIEADSGREVHVRAGHAKPANGFAWTAGGARLVSVGGDGTLRVWDPTARSEVKSVQAEMSLDCVVLSPDGKVAVTGEAGAAVRFWNLEEAREVRKADLGEMGSRALVRFPDGAGFVVLTSEGTVRAFDFEGKEREAPPVGTGVSAMAWSPDGARIACAKESGIEILDAKSGESRASVTLGGEMCHALAWTPDGARLLTGQTDKKAVVRDAKSLAEARTLSPVDSPYHLAVSPDGRLAAVAGFDFAAVWNLADGTKVWDGGSNQAQGPVAFLGDAKWAVATRPGAIAIVTAGK